MALHLVPHFAPEESAPPDSAKTLSADIVQDMVRTLRELVANRGSSALLRVRGDPARLLMFTRQLPVLLSLLEKYPPPTDPNVRYIPPCPLCNAPAGEHWAHDCTSIHPNARDNFVYDYRRKRLLAYINLDDPFRPMDPRDYAPGAIPRCGVCGKGPGAHWPDECPDNPIRDKMRGERVVPPSEQRINPDWEERKRFEETGLLPGE